MLSTIDTIALQMLEGVGDQTIRNLILSKMDLPEVRSLSERELRSYFSTAKGAESFKEKFADFQEKATYEVDKLQDSNIKIVSYHDSFYPKNLKRLEDFPILLYCIGNLDLLKINKNVAVIGTRDNSAVGKKITKNTAAHFASKGYTIVSGLAKGIDAIGHEAALDAEGFTIAVLIDILKIYPKENNNLANRILNERGLIIAENKPGSYQGKNAFVLRDRIQSGLSLAIFPIETDVIGGTMHTVKYAKKQRRLIFVPDVNNESLKNMYEQSVGLSYSKINGIKELIRNGDGFPYTKDNYRIIESKLADALERLDGNWKTQSINRPEENFSSSNLSDLKNQTDISSNDDSQLSIEKATQNDTNDEQSRSPVTAAINNHDDRESSSPKKSSDTHPPIKIEEKFHGDLKEISEQGADDDFSQEQSKEDDLLVEYVRYFMNEFKQYVFSKESIITNKQNIILAINKLDKNLKKLLPKKKKPTKNKSKKKGDMF